MKKIALIHDLSGLGKCSLTAAIPVISVMGAQACPMPTAVLTAQTGFPSFYLDDYTDKMDVFTSEWEKLSMRFDGIYSGYLASTVQMEKVLYFLDTFQGKNTLYLADPVMGDHGKTIPQCDEAFLAGMRRLVARSAICTPNLTELCLLAGVSYAKLEPLFSDKEALLSRIQEISLAILEQNKSVYGTTEAVQTVLTTGILHTGSSKALIGNLAITLSHTTNEVQTFYVETPYTGTGFSGTGDLFASVICGGLVKGLALSECMELATKFLQPAIEEATAAKTNRNHGVNFEKYLNILL